MGHHLADHHELLVILLAKNCHALGFARKHAGEQFHDDGGHTGEKSRSEFAFQDVTQGRIGLHLDGLRLRVQVCFARREHHIAARRFELGAVGLPGAGVTVKVFVRQKLQTVHKDAGDSQVALRPCPLDQLDVAGMQVAHGGHKGGTLALGQVLAQFSNRSGDEHERNRPYQACKALSGKLPSLTART